MNIGNVFITIDISILQHEVRFIQLIRSKPSSVCKATCSIFNTSLAICTDGLVNTYYNHLRYSGGIGSKSSPRENEMSFRKLLVSSLRCWCNDIVRNMLWRWLVPFHDRKNGRQYGVAIFFCDYPRCDIFHMWTCHRLGKLTLTTRCTSNTVTTEKLSHGGDVVYCLFLCRAH